MSEAVKKVEETPKVKITAAMRGKAQKSLEDAIIALLYREPFFAYVIQAMRRHYSEAIDLAGVSVKNGVIDLWVNPYTWLGLKGINERVAILKHEVYHLVNEHTFRRGDRNHFAFNIACFKPGELISTPDGESPIDTLSSGDRVYQHDGSVGHVSATMKRNFTGNLYRVEAMGVLPIVATGEHPLLVCRRRRRTHYPIEMDDPEWVKIQDVKERDYLLIPRIPLSEETRVISVTGFVKSTSRALNRVPSEVKKGLVLDEELAWIMGLYVAEGSRGSRNANICFSLHIDETSLADKVLSYFTKIGYSPKTYNNVVGNSMQVLVPTTILNRAFSSWFGCGAANKKIPDFIKSATPNIIRAFIRGYTDGDGCQTRDNTNVAGSASETLARQMQLMTASIGQLCNIHRYVRQNAGRVIGKSVVNYNQIIYLMTWVEPKSTQRQLNGKQPIMSTSHRWKVMDDYIAVPVKSISTEPYEGPVYNIETDGHSYLVSNVSVHNCDIAINPYIKNLPTKLYNESMKVVTPDMFGLPDGKIAEWYYNRLPRSHGHGPPGGDGEGWCPIHDPPPGSKGSNGDGDGEGKDGDQDGDQDGDGGGGKDDDGNDKNGTGRSKASKKLSREDCPFCQRKKREGKGKGGFPGEGQPGKGQTLDDHSKWDESQSEDSTKEYDIETVRRVLDRAVDECKNRGTIPGELLSAIERVRKSELPWKWLLKQFIVRATQVTSIHTRFRPNRRMKWVYPGRRVDYRLKLVFAVDTSGSMSDDQLDQLAAEIEATKDFADVWVIECDASIPEDGVYLMDRQELMKRKKNWNWRGRGGTDLRPPFQHAIDEIKPDAMIYGTDGYGPAPDSPPPFPVMWVFTENHHPPATWGQKVVLKNV